MSTPDGHEEPKKRQPDRGRRRPCGHRTVDSGAVGPVHGFLGFFGIGEAVTTGNWTVSGTILASDLMVPLFFVVIGVVVLRVGMEFAPAKMRYAISVPDGQADPHKKGSLTGAGIALVVIGLLILVPSGLCTGLLGIIGRLDGVTKGNGAVHWTV